jgi:hypothetical protein
MDAAGQNSAFSSSYMETAELKYWFPTPDMETSQNKNGSPARVVDMTQMESGSPSLRRLRDENGFDLWTWRF